jgi:hypothetical protein
MPAEPKSSHLFDRPNIKGVTPTKVQPIPKRVAPHDPLVDQLSRLTLTPGNFIPVATTPQRPSAPLNLEGGRKTRKCKNDATFVWLNLWYKNEFEKLGWMVLAKNKGYDDKVEGYKNSVQRLYYQVGCKVKETKDHDKKQDLMIMLKDVKCLMDHIYKDF